MPFNIRLSAKAREALISFLAVGVIILTWRFSGLREWVLSLF